MLGFSSSKFCYTKWHLIILIDLFLFFTIINAKQGAHTRRGLQPSFDRIKEQTIRNQTAKEILGNMNLEANPCQDFFDFACGKWAENHASQQHIGELTTPQSELEKSVNNELQSLLNDSAKFITPSVRKVANFYQSCIAVQSTSPAQKEFMVNFLREMGGIPSMPNTDWRVDYDWLKITANLRRFYGIEVLIGFEIGTNLENMRGNSVYLGEPKTTIIPSENCSAVAMETVDARDEAYKALQDEISKNMQRWLSMRETDAERFGGDVIRFEFELCKKMRIEQSLEEPEVEDNELEGRFPINNVGQNRLHKKHNVGNIIRFNIERQGFIENTIDLRRYVNFILGPYNEQVYLSAEQYLKHLARIIKGTGKFTIANYLMYRALSAFNLPSDEHLSRPAYCVQLVQKYFPKIAGELYTRRSQRNELRQEVEDYFTKITESFDKTLQADWMTQRSKTSARQKLAQFKARFPVYQNLDLTNLHFEGRDYWQILDMVMRYNADEDLSRLSKVDLDARPAAIEAYDVRTKLMPLDSEILIGWALLQPPLYHSSYPRAMKYAMLGHRLASELIMAFDEQGWRPSALSAIHLDEETAETFKNQSECYRTQYSNYLYNNPEEFRNASRLREIIADSNGLNVAFNAYLSWLEELPPNRNMPLIRETLPSVDFTNTQLFFIHFAQTRCAAKFGEEPPSDFFPLDKHTPERYDINGPLSNFKEFAREFNCKPGEEMHQVDKCVLYT